jgi:hypothetical protein
MTRLERLRNRRIDPLILTAPLLNEVYDRIEDDEVIRYAIGAMQPLEPEYQAGYLSESRLIQNHLRPKAARAGIPVDFLWQGSLTNDTHISFSSDLEILVIDGNFTTLEPPQKAIIPYTENPVEELRSLRNLALESVKAAWPEAEMDTSDPFRILCAGGGLKREIRLYFANWYHSNVYITHREEKFRGLNILDNHKDRRVCRFPFLHNALIEEKDALSKGSLKKMVRLLKSLLDDGEERYGLPGYHLSSLIWNMPERNLAYGRGQELQLIQSAYDYLIYVLTNERYRNNLKVPDGTANIFDPEGATKNQLQITSKLLGGLAKDILQVLQRSSRTLAQVHIDY